jgi:two-component system, probable response regulator PhcQ
MKTRTLLVVDDDESIRRALELTLTRDGYVVHVASDGAEALRMLRQHKIDVIVSDHMMPEMTGLELLKLARDRHPDVGRIMLTAYGDVDTAIKAINEGEINRFLTKPWHDTELKVTIHTVFTQVELARENQALLATVRRQADHLLELRRDYPEIFSVRRDDEGAILLSDEEINKSQVH